ncbi:hypothetical protein SAMN04487770_12144 [Butyrivibrio sp. ob235]|uniref:hypothetical protein n=1 Tax=Butyrivibrio sp. ob235 TaxID=1761780 RepID=UPI0008B0C900|nr:hypothetical protein [Butyrivibrio sp. ob235]SEL93729.1 hypothetical protein SAMN04487770_12144 [Butyrivibrio sp. ob235]
MKRVYSKVMGVICMAATIFSVATSSVNVSAAGFYNPSKSQGQTKTTSQSRTSTGSSTTTERKSTSGNKTLLTKEKETVSKSSYLTSEQEKILAKLENDYSKINWGVQYSPKDMDGIIISVSSYMEDTMPFLVIGITNIYNDDVTFSATGYAKGKSGQEVADISIYETAIRPGNTIIKSVYCDSTPTGEIHWDNIELPEVYETSAYATGDWTFTTDSDGYYMVDYSIKSDDYMMPGYVTAVLVDSNGNILDMAYNFTTDKGYTVSDSIKFYEKEYSRRVADVAMFTNPLIED